MRNKQCKNVRYQYMYIYIYLETNKNKFHTTIVRTFCVICIIHVTRQSRLVLRGCVFVRTVCT